MPHPDKNRVATVIDSNAISLFNLINLHKYE